MYKNIIIFISSLALATPAFAATGVVNLPVPHIWEIPGGVWVKPWNGACEEASAAMIEHFYLGNKDGTLPRATMKKLMSPLFPIENRLFGGNSDTDAARTTKLINDYMMFDATIVDNPTLEDIKAELDAGRPVISLHYGYNLKNPKHSFRRGGSSYHVMAIVGYNDTKKIFYVNDPELLAGLDYPYDYDTILTTLHDFNFTNHQADGPARVLFTTPKQIVKATNSNRIYLVQNGVKHYITSPQVFGAHRLVWKAIKTIDRATLDSYETGDQINT